LGLFAAWIIFIDTYTIGTRFLTSVDGTVVSSETSTGNRPTTSYQIKGPDGSISEYVAGPTDKSLPRRMPVGTQIRKKKYELGYVLNGQTVHDFPLAFYALLIGIGLTVAGFVLVRTGRRPPAAH
jgi:hypothetical protein